MHSLIIFASGRGSNARAIIDYFKKNRLAKVSLIVTNKADAGVLDIAAAEGIPTMVVKKQIWEATLLLSNYSRSILHCWC